MSGPMGHERVASTTFNSIINRPRSPESVPILIVLFSSPASPLATACVFRAILLRRQDSERLFLPLAMCLCTDWMLRPSFVTNGGNLARCCDVGVALGRGNDI
jgi:hypothetical protein